METFGLLIYGTLLVPNVCRCARCEAMVGVEVCGRNGKTYNSLGHAVNCGGLREEDIAAAPCAPDVRSSYDIVRRTISLI